MASNEVPEFTPPPVSPDQDEFIVIPAWIRLMPPATGPFAACPHCRAYLKPPPKKARDCPHCGQRFHVRVGHDGIRRIVTRDGMIELECLWAELTAGTMFVTMHCGSPEEVRRSKERQRMRVYREAREQVMAKYHDV